MVSLTLAPTVVEHSAVVAAPADVIFDMVARVELWPQFHEPSVHAEYVVRGDGEDVVKRWMLDGETVNVVLAHRILDRAGLRIEQRRLDPPPPLEMSTVVWRFLPISEHETRVELSHEFRTLAEDFARQVRHNGQRQLNAVADAAARRDELSHLVLTFTDPLFIGGSVEDAYAFLYEADKWPERVEHVSRIDMTETVPNVQFFDMDTHTPDGEPHTTRSVRLCFPTDLIVYKQIHLPKLLDAHTGHWRFTTTLEGVVAEARHTVTVKQAALALLGPDATVADARRYLRRVLSANSMNSLRHAKDFAEKRTIA